MDNKQGGGSTILIVIVVILILAGLGSCVGNSDSGNSSKCGSCGRTYTNSDDRSSIAWRNMCENCYDNYKFSQDLKDELNKYEERYGN